MSKIHLRGPLTTPRRSRKEEQGGIRPIRPRAGLSLRQRLRHTHVVAVNCQPGADSLFRLELLDSAQDRASGHLPLNRLDSQLAVSAGGPPG